MIEFVLGRVELSQHPHLCNACIEPDVQCWKISSLPERKAINFLQTRLPALQPSCVALMESAK